MYMDALESEVESLSSEVTRLRLMLHRVTQVMEAPPMAEAAYNTASAASTGHPSSFAHPMPTFHRPAPQHTDPMSQVQQLLELIKQAGSSDVLRQLLSLEKSNEMGDSTDSHPTRMGASYKVDRRRTKAPPLNDVDLAAEGVAESKGRSSFSSDEVHSGIRHPYSGKPPQAAGKGQQPFVDNLGDETIPDQANNNNNMNNNNKRSSDTMYMSKTPGMWSFPTPMMADRGEGSTLASPTKESHAPKKEASSSPPTAAAATAKRLSVAERLQQLKEEPSSSYKLDDSALPPAAGRLGAKAAVNTRNIEDSQQSTESMVMPSMNTTESVIGKPYQTPKSSLPQAAATTTAAPAVGPNGNDTSSVSFSFSHCVPGGTGRKDDDMPQANTLAEPPTTTASPTMPPNAAANTTKLVPAQTSVLSHNSSEEEDPNVPIMGQGQEAVILGARKSIGYGGGGSPPLGPSGARPSSAVDTSPNLTPTKGMRTQAQPRESILDRLRRHTGGYDTSEEDEEEEDDDDDDDVGAEPREHTQAHYRVEDRQMEEDGGERRSEGYDDAQGSNRAGSASQSGVNANSPERMHYTPVNASRNENGYSYGTLDAYSLGWHSPSRGASPQQPAIESNHNNNNAHASPSAAKSVSARSVADYDWGIASSHAAGPSMKSSHSELPSTGYYDF